MGLWKNKFTLLSLLLAMHLGFSLIACSGKGAETSSSSSDPTDPDDPDSAPPNVVNDIGFYVKVANDTKYASYMSKGTSFGSACSISTSAASSQDIVCTVDAQEGDLFFHGLQLNYNVPPTMCKYMRMMPYYYYKHSTGYGPSALSITVDITNDIKTITGCTVTEADGSVIAGCSGQKEVTFLTNSMDATCVYDRSDFGGKNCCFGDYTFTKVTTGDTPGTEVVKGNWGGTWSSCLSGPAIRDWNHAADNGYPIPLVYYTEGSGLNEVYKVSGPIDKRLGENYTVSNYYGDMDHTHNGFVDARTTTLPYAFDPVDDLDGSAMPIGKDAYTFECLDTSWEVKHRIRIYVREWNTYSQFIAFGASEGVSGNPNVGGVEDGINCDYSSNFNYGNCNDMWDFDDLLNSLDGDFTTQTDVYDTSSPSASLRRSWHSDE